MQHVDSLIYGINIMSYCQFTNYICTPASCLATKYKNIVSFSLLLTHGSGITEQMPVPRARAVGSDKKG